jgi:hypothetical protein
MAPVISTVIHPVKDIEGHLARLLDAGAAAG